MKKVNTIFGAILFASVILTSCGDASKDSNKTYESFSAEPIKVDSISVNNNDQKNNLKINKTLLPQPIDYDGKPDLEYTINNKIIALDSYNDNDSEGLYLRMKYNNKEVILKMEKHNSTKAKRVYFNSDYVVTFYDIIYGDCAGEGAQYLTGKLLVQTVSEQNTVMYKGSDTLYSSKECKEMGQ